LKIATYPIVCREDEKSVVVPILIGGRITGMEESAGKKGMCQRNNQYLRIPEWMTPKPGVAKKEPIQILGDLNWRPRVAWVAGVDRSTGSPPQLRTSSIWLLLCSWF
jgi:hypothetical protein